MSFICDECGTNDCDNCTEKSDVEQIWDEFWKPIVTNEDGTLNFEQVKKELLDFKLVMDLVPTVYDNITGGRFTKLLTSPEYIISAAEEHFKLIFEEDLETETDKSLKTLESEIDDWKSVNRIIRAKFEIAENALQSVVNAPARETMRRYAEEALNRIKE